MNIGIGINGYILAAAALLLPLIMMVVSLWNRGAKTAAIGTTVVMAVAILCGVVLFWASTGQVNALNARPTAMPATASPADETFFANIYASETDAAKAVARQVLAILQDPAYATDARVGLTIADSVSESAQHEVRRMLAPFINDGPPAKSAITIDMKRYASKSGKPHNGQNEPESQICATIRTANDQLTRQANYINKSWVNGNMTGLGDGDDLIRIHDSALWESEAAARQAARNQAGRRLLDRVQASLTQLFPHEANRWASPEGREKATEHILASLTARPGEFIRDEFVQRFPRPYGDLWQVRLLLDASTAKTADLAHSLVQSKARSDVARQATRRSTGGRILRLLGMVVVICLVYAFLNAATRGYYVWALRIAAAVTLVGLALVIA